MCLRVDIDDAFSLLISIGICEYLNQCSAIVIGRRHLVLVVTDSGTPKARLNFFHRTLDSMGYLSSFVIYIGLTIIGKAIYFRFGILMKFLVRKNIA